MTYYHEFYLNNKFNNSVLSVLYSTAFTNYLQLIVDNLKFLIILVISTLFFFVFLNLIQISRAKAIILILTNFF